MIKYLALLTVSSLLFTACLADDEDNKTTIYEGIVVFEEDNTPVSGATLNFLGKKAVAGIGQLDETILERDIILSDNGSFRFELSTTKSNIDYFSVGLYIENSPVSMDCVPNSCASLTPRTIVTDMQFLAERE